MRGNVHQPGGGYIHQNVPRWGSGYMHICVVPQTLCDINASRWGRKGGGGRMSSPNRAKVGGAYMRSYPYSIWYASSWGGGVGVGWGVRCALMSECYVAGGYVAWCFSPTILTFFGPIFDVFPTNSDVFPTNFRWIFHDSVKSHQWIFYDQRKSGNEPSMTHWLTFYEISLIHRLDLLRAQTG